MPQMAINALSELWLLKELGDIHWQLISNGLQQKSSEFGDGLGNRLYATFVRIHYTISPLYDFKEDTTLPLNGSIRRYGNDAYLSVINGVTDSCFLDAQLMTCFSQRETQSNSKILKGVLKENLNYIEKTDSSPEFLNQYRFLRKGLINEIEHKDFKFIITDEEVAIRAHKILPYYEINGVGLLYFACYPIISDTAVSDIMETLGIVSDFKMRYFTIFRDIFYFANCDVNDKVIVKLNDIELLVNDCIKYSTSLYRKSDNALMARIFTVKKLCTESCQ
ncbi:LnmK family bifunctional acyltransferase/decarboxylase [Pontibacter sp. H259]|uniref:LnmK family bifunctional acyltransferase/decarboxylase n=1 Tax=Pontibacter sp. H259 TaxID=3133421 RepID=UPI0030BC1191